MVKDTSVSFLQMAMLKPIPYWQSQYWCKEGYYYYENYLQLIYLSLGEEGHHYQG